MFSVPVYILRPVSQKRDILKLKAQLHIAKNWVWQGIRNCVIFAVLDSAGQKIYATNLSNQKQLKLIRSWGLAFPALQRECLF